MTDDTRWQLLLPSGLRNLPADLAAVVVLVFLTIAAVVLPGIRTTPLRVLFGLPFVLFVPGYAFIAALFPEQGHGPSDEETPDAGSSTRGIDGIERVALSFGLSIAIVPLIGLILNFTPWGIRLGPVLASVSAFTLVATVVAARRRWELPSEERFRVPYGRWIEHAKAEFLDPDTQRDQVLNVLLVLSILLAVSSVGYAVAVPKPGESFTELYLLTENEDGELVADGYPSTVTAGEAQPLVVGIGNHEHEQVQYTLLVELHRVQTQNNSTTVLQREQLTRFDPTLDANETWHQPHTVRPTLTGERLRLTYLLYRGSPPQQPSVDSAYRETHLWLNVT